MAGLPGTGKTTLAEALAKRLGGIVLSKDKVRAVLFPGAAITYGGDQNDFCMSVVLMAAQRIAVEHSVPFIFLDGRTFSRRAQIDQVIAAAQLADAEVSILHLDCPEEIALERIRKDQGQHEAKNRNPELYFRVKAHFEPITLPKVDVDTSRPLEECVERCVEYLIGKRATQDHDTH
jgi:adenylylsulfate kinase